MKIIFEPSATRDIKKLDIPIQRRVLATLDDFSMGKFVDIRKLEGMNAIWRIRVGDYRIVLEIVVIDDVAYVLKVRHRREVYR